MQTRRWVNQSQPQTLYIATFLFYFDAALLVLSGGLFSGLGLFLAAGWVASGYFIANERKVGYALGVAFSLLGLLPYVMALLAGQNILAPNNAIGLMFAVALVALVLHPQSREYQRIWFK
jgi:hypothetical protein